MIISLKKYSSIIVETAIVNCLTDDIKSILEQLSSMPILTILVSLLVTLLVTFLIPLIVTFLITIIITLLVTLQVTFLVTL